jgi:hypothetical protein
MKIIFILQADEVVLWGIVLNVHAPIKELVGRLV